MKLEVERIRIAEGQFHVLSPEEALHPAKDGTQPKNTLMVGCKFVLVNHGNVVAEGTASNIPGAAGAKTVLSETTLRAFQEFFSSLEHDIANALSMSGKEKKEDGNLLAEIMGRR